MRSTLNLTAVAVCGLALPCLAQTGTQDQFSPTHPSPPGQTASYNLDTPILIWQQQIRVGIAGQLEGIVIGAIGPATAQMTLKIRPGAANSTQPPVFEGVVRKTREGEENIFVDMTASNIVMDVGDVFVMDTQGDDSDFNLLGSYVPPDSGQPPMYPEPLFLNGSVFVPGWRHGFTTYVIAGGGCVADFNGDGTANVQDFLAYLQAFSAGEDRADINDDGVINVQDFLSYLQAFAAGC
jgi:hypothetical protein